MGELASGSRSGERKEPFHGVKGRFQSVEAGRRCQWNRASADTSGHGVSMPPAFDTQVRARRGLTQQSPQVHHVTPCGRPPTDKFGARFY